MPTKKNSDTLDVIANNNLTTLFVDDVYVHPRKDGIYYIRYTTFLPEGDVEQARLITDEVHFQDIINTLCAAANYYPKKPINKKQKKQDISSEPGSDSV